MTYNFSTNSVDVFADGKNETDAQADKVKAIDDAVTADNNAAKAAQIALDAADA